MASTTRSPTSSAYWPGKHPLRRTTLGRTTLRRAPLRRTTLPTAEQGNGQAKVLGKVLQADMPMFRNRLTADILQGSATAPASPPS